MTMPHDDTVSCLNCSTEIFESDSYCCESCGMTYCATCIEDHQTDCALEE